jgi:hypothetical protein
MRAVLCSANTAQPSYAATHIVHTKSHCALVCVRRYGIRTLEGICCSLHVRICPNLHPAMPHHVASAECPADAELAQHQMAHAMCQTCTPGNPYDQRATGPALTSKL